MQSSGAPVYFDVYQEWDVLREKVELAEQKIEKPTVHTEMSSLPVQIQEARIRLRLTVLDLAMKCQVSPKSMSMYENGSEIPSDEVLQTLKTILSL